MVQIQDGFRGSRMTVLPASVTKEMEADPITASLHVTDIGYYPHAQYHFINRPTGAPQYILIYCTDGRGWVSLREERHTLRAGDFIIIPKDMPHSYGADDAAPWSIYWVHFDGTVAGCLSEGARIPCQAADTESGLMTSVTDIFEDIMRPLERGYSRDGLRLSSMALMHFIGAIRFGHTGMAEAAEGMGQEDAIERCRKYINDNIESDIRSSDIYEYLGRSSSYCTVLFREKTGMTPGQFLQHQRIQTAAHIFDVTGMRVNQVCHKVGIKDPYYFSRLFTKILGIPPSEYRRQRRLK